MPSTIAAGNNTGCDSAKDGMLLAHDTLIRLRVINFGMLEVTSITKDVIDFFSFLKDVALS